MKKLILLLTLMLSAQALATEVTFVYRLKDKSELVLDVSTVNGDPSRRIVYGTVKRGGVVLSLFGREGLKIPNGKILLPDDYVSKSGVIPGVEIDRQSNITDNLDKDGIFIIRVQDQSTSDLFIFPIAENFDWHARTQLYGDIARSYHLIEPAINPKSPYREFSVAYVQPDTQQLGSPHANLLVSVADKKERKSKTSSPHGTVVTDLGGAYYLISEKWIDVSGGQYVYRQTPDGRNYEILKSDKGWTTLQAPMSTGASGWPKAQKEADKAALQLQVPSQATLPAQENNSGAELLLTHQAISSRDRVALFKFLREEAKAKGWKLYLIGDAAASFVHYLKLDNVRQAGGALRAAFFDYDFINIFRAKQDVKIAYDNATPEQMRELAIAVRRKFPLPPNQAQIKFESLTNVIASYPDGDSISAGMMELTDSQAPLFRDWSTGSSQFAEDVTNGHIHFLPNAKNAVKQNAIFAAMRMSATAVRNGLTADSSSAEALHRVLLDFDPNKDLQTPSDVQAFSYLVEGMYSPASEPSDIAHYFKSVPGLWEKVYGTVIHSSGLSVPNLMAYGLWDQSPVGQGEGPTAQELNLGLLAIPVLFSDYYDAWVGPHTVPVSLFQRDFAFLNKNDAKDGVPAKVVGDAPLEFGPRLHLLPTARLGSDFEYDEGKGIVRIKNFKAIAVLPESLNASPLQFFADLNAGLGMTQVGLKPAYNRLEFEVAKKADRISIGDLTQIVAIAKSTRTKILLETFLSMNFDSASKRAVIAEQMRNGTPEIINYILTKEVPKMSAEDQAAIHVAAQGNSAAGEVRLRNLRNHVTDKNEAEVLALARSEWQSGLKTPSQYRNIDAFIHILYDPVISKYTDLATMILTDYAADKVNFDPRPLIRAAANMLSADMPTSEKTQLVRQWVHLLRSRPSEDSDISVIEIICESNLQYAPEMMKTLIQVYHEGRTAVRAGSLLAQPEIVNHMDLVQAMLIGPGVEIVTSRPDLDSLKRSVSPVYINNQVFKMSHWRESTTIKNFMAGRALTIDNFRQAFADGQRLAAWPPPPVEFASPILRCGGVL